MEFDREGVPAWKERWSDNYGNNEKKSLKDSARKKLAEARTTLSQQRGNRLELITSVFIGAMYDSEEWSEVQLTIDSGVGIITPSHSATSKNHSKLAFSSQAEALAAKPWLEIPDHNWDRCAVELLWMGYMDSEIADKCSVDNPKTVTNRLSALRGQHPKLVPRRMELKKLPKN